MPPEPPDQPSAQGISSSYPLEQDKERERDLVWSYHVSLGKYNNNPKEGSTAFVTLSPKSDVRKWFN